MMKELFGSDNLAEDDAAIEEALDANGITEKIFGMTPGTLE